MAAVSVAVAVASQVGVLAGSPEFHRNGARQGLVVNVAQLLGHDSARVRIAAAGACALSPACLLRGSAGCLWSKSSSRSQSVAGDTVSASCLICPLIRSPQLRNHVMLPA